MEKVRELINSVKEGKNGYSLNKPWRLEKTSFAVIPIINEIESEREYITFAEAQDVKVEDTGQIDFVYVKNNENLPLLICRGEIFKGKTQERASIHDYLIMPGKGNRVSVRCIHASKGIQSGAEMTYGGRTSNSINLSDQTKTWNTVNSTVSGYYASNNSSATINPSVPSTSTTSTQAAIIEESNRISESVNCGITSSFHPNIEHQDVMQELIEKSKQVFGTNIEKPIVGSCGTSGASGTAYYSNSTNQYSLNNSSTVNGASSTSGSSGSGGSGGNGKKKENKKSASTMNTITTNSVTNMNNVTPWTNNGTSWTNGVSYNFTTGSVYATPGSINGWQVQMPHITKNEKTDDYTTAFESMRVKVKEIMKKVPYIKNQVGAILFKENDILGIDIYSHPDSWEQIKQDIIAKEGSSFMNNPEEDDLFILNPEAYNRIVNKKVPDKFEEKIVYNKEYKVMELKSETLLGEVLIYKNKVLHLTMWNKNN